MRESEWLHHGGNEEKPCEASFIDCCVREVIKKIIRKEMTG